jgi:hypothetical protein
MGFLDDALCVANLCSANPEFYERNLPRLSFTA